MIDWLTILLALAIIAALVGVFGVMAWKINMPDASSTDPLVKRDDANELLDSTNDKRKKDKSGSDQGKKKRKEQKKSKRDNRQDDDSQQQKHNKVKFQEPSAQNGDETDDEREESEQVSSIFVFERE